jgi:death-on-curing family protein
MQKITVKEVEYTAFALAQEIMSFDEPIPDFKTRFPNILESCIAAPFQAFHEKSFYPSLIDKAAILFYLLIKNHPFQNDNKRIAMTTLFVFLHKNKRWIKSDAQALYNFTIWIAASPAKFKDETLSAIKKFITEHIIDLTSSK